MTRYDCHSIDAGPRSQPVPIQVQAGWTPDGRRLMRTHDPVWVPIKCGHVEQAGRGPDPKCNGCENRGF